MRNVIVAALAAMVLLCPPAASAAYGPVQTVNAHGFPSIRGGLTTITTDTVVLEASGAQWATVQFKATTAGTSTVTAQVSLDGGTNWLSSAYAKRLSTVAASPTVQAIAATTLVAADVWEVPLPANATHFRLQCAASGTTTTVFMYGAQPYVPGVPVFATLYDVTETNIGDGLTTTVDFSGWNLLQAVLVSPTTQSWTVQAVDDAGSVIGIAITTTAPSTSSQLVSPGEPAATASISNNVFGVLPAIDRRIKYTLAAGGTGTKGRARIVARR